MEIDVEEFVKTVCKYVKNQVCRAHRPCNLVKYGYVSAGGIECRPPNSLVQCLSHPALYWRIRLV